MAGEISIAGIYADALAPPVAVPNTRSGTQHAAAAPEAPITLAVTASQAGVTAETKNNGLPTNKTELASILGRMQNAFPPDNITLAYERDSEDGRMYLHVRNKLTGKEILRIPKNYIQTMDTQPGNGLRVDVHI